MARYFGKNNGARISKVMMIIAASAALSFAFGFVLDGGVWLTIAIFLLLSAMFVYASYSSRTQ